MQEKTKGNNRTSNIKVLYLFNGVRKGLIEKIVNGKEHDDHFFGMLRLTKYGVKAGYLEIEQYVPRAVAAFLRRFINIYYIHILLFWKFFSYDIVFTSSAFGSQFVHTLLHIKRPKWVMYDFSITGFIGNAKTTRQRIFKWMTGRASGIITLSKKEAVVLKEMFPHMKEVIQFIPFGVDLSFFKPKDVSEKHQILSVGFAPDRDYETLFAATKDLDIPVVITRSRSVDSFKNLPSYVKSQSFSSRELVEEYVKSKIVVLPLDITDGRNLASGCSTLVEAMAMGSAIIATRTPTTESYITHGENGILVEQKDTEELRDAIKELLQDDTKRKEMGQKAREFTEKNCDADAVAEKMSEFFRELGE